MALEDQFNQVSNIIALFIEAAAVIVVTFGAIQVLAGLVVAAAQGRAGEQKGRELWLRFATWILLALEFALAADLVRTAVAPTWDDISEARRHRHHPHHAQLFPRQGYCILR